MDMMPTICIVRVSKHSGKLETIIPYIGGFVPVDPKRMENIRDFFSSTIDGHLAVTGQPGLPPEYLKSSVESVLSQIEIDGKNLFSLLADRLMPIDIVTSVCYNSKSVSAIYRNP